MEEKSSKFEKFDEKFLMKFNETTPKPDTADKILEQSQLIYSDIYDLKDEEYLFLKKEYNIKKLELDLFTDKSLDCGILKYEFDFHETKFLENNPNIMKIIDIGKRKILESNPYAMAKSNLTSGFIEIQQYTEKSIGKEKYFTWHYDSDAGASYTIIFYIVKDPTLIGGSLLYKDQFGQVLKYDIISGLVLHFDSDLEHCPESITSGVGVRQSIVIQFY